MKISQRILYRIFLCLALLPISVLQASCEQKCSKVSCPDTFVSSVCPVKTGLVTCEVDPEIIITGIIRIAYRQYGICDGSKPTIVFLHGFGGSSLDWACNQALLCNDFCSVAIDLRGHGNSDVPLVAGPAAYTLEQLTNDVLCVINDLGITNPIIVGESLGGIVAMNLVLQNPGLASKLVLSDTTALPFPPNPQVPICPVPPCPPNPTVLSPENPLGLNVLFFLALAQIASGGTPEDIRDAAIFGVHTRFNERCEENPAFQTFLDQQVEVAIAGFENFNKAIARFFILQNIITPPFVYNIADPNTGQPLQDITIPTLITRGQIDQIIPGVQASEFLRNFIPNSYFVELRGKGSTPNMTDVFNWTNTVRNFLTGADLECNVCLLSV